MMHRPWIGSTLRITSNTIPTFLKAAMRCRRWSPCCRGHGYYEPGLGIAGDDLVAIPGRIRGWAKKPQVVTDIFRVEGGMLAEHWDVLQQEVPAASGAAGRAMFDPNEAVKKIDKWKPHP